MAVRGQKAKHLPPLARDMSMATYRNTNQKQAHVLWHCDRTPLCGERGQPIAVHPISSAPCLASTPPHGVQPPDPANVVSFQGDTQHAHVGAPYTTLSNAPEFPQTQLSLVTVLRAANYRNLLCSDPVHSSKGRNRPRPITSSELPAILYDLYSRMYTMARPSVYFLLFPSFRLTHLSIHRALERRTALYQLLLAVGRPFGQPTTRIPALALGKSSRVSF